jgi:hypothetical protein
VWNYLFRKLHPSFEFAGKLFLPLFLPSRKKSDSGLLPNPTCLAYLACLVTVENENDEFINSDLTTYFFPQIRSGP